MYVARALRAHVCVWGTHARSHCAMRQTLENIFMVALAPNHRHRAAAAVLASRRGTSRLAIVHVEYDDVAESRTER